MSRRNKTTMKVDQISSIILPYVVDKEIDILKDRRKRYKPDGDATNFEPYKLVDNPSRYFSPTFDPSEKPEKISQEKAHSQRN